MLKPWYQKLWGYGYRLAPDVEAQGGHAKRRWIALCSATVAVVESAKVWGGDDFAGTIFDRSRFGRVAFEVHVTVGLTVISLVLQERPEKMLLAECDDVIGKRSMDRSEDSLRVRVLPRRLPGADQFF